MSADEQTCEAIFGVFGRCDQPAQLVVAIMHNCCNTSTRVSFCEDCHSRIGLTGVCRDCGELVISVMSEPVRLRVAS